MATLTDLAKKGKIKIKPDEGQKIWTEVVDLVEARSHGAVIQAVDQGIVIVEMLAADLPEDDTHDVAALMEFALIALQVKDNEDFKEPASELLRDFFNVMPNDRYIMGLFLYILLKDIVRRAGEK